METNGHRFEYRVEPRPETKYSPATFSVVRRAIGGGGGWQVAQYTHKAAAERVAALLNQNRNVENV